MARAARTDAHVLLLSANWQALFMTAAILGWLTLVGTTLLSFMQSGYVSAGTWVFQITTWVLPAAYLAVSFWLLGKYAPFGKRLFMAFLAATIGMNIFGALDTLVNRAWYTYVATQPPGIHDTSWWTAFGSEWVMMSVGLVVFAGVLYWTTRKSRR